MFEEKLACPVAITHTVDDVENCYNEAISWAIDYLRDGEKLTVWTAQKNTLDGNDYLQNLIAHPRVRHVTQRGGTGFNANGPVVAFYVHREDLADFNRVRGMTALSVVTWSHPLNVWAKEVGAETLVEDQPGRYEDPLIPSEYAAPIGEETRKELESLTSRINLNNGISGGFEKRYVVRSLNTMRERNILPDPKAAIEWTAAHGWQRDRPKKFGEMVEKVAAGRALRG